MLFQQGVSVLNHVQLFATPWTVAHQAPVSMGFSREEYWKGVPFTPPGDLPNPGIEPRAPAPQADSFFFLKLYIIVLVLPNIKMT